MPSVQHSPVRGLASPKAKNSLNLHLRKVAEKWVKVNISPNSFYGRRLSHPWRLQDREPVSLYEEIIPLKGEVSLEVKVPMEDKGLLEDKKSIKENEPLVLNADLEDKLSLPVKLPVGDKEAVEVNVPLKAKEPITTKKPLVVIPRENNWSIENNLLIDNFEPCKESFIDREAELTKESPEEMTVIEEEVFAGESSSRRVKGCWEMIEECTPKQNEQLVVVPPSPVTSKDAGQEATVATVESEAGSDESEGAGGLMVSERALLQDLEAIPMVVLEKLSAKTLARYYFVKM